MSTSDYTTDLKALKESLDKLNKEGLDLSSAMQTYKEGLAQHEQCVSTLTTLEQHIENSEWRIEPVELNIEDIFSSLDTVEQSIESLPETHLEDCIELLIQAEHLLQAGYRQLDLANDTLNNSERTTTSKTMQDTNEVHRV